MNPGGEFSAEARRRLAAGAAGGHDLVLPDLTDPAAVAAWRQSQHEAWGEGLVVGEPDHRAAVVGGVWCLRAGTPAGAVGDPEGPVVVYAHGGGFCLGSPGTAAPITARLARAFPVVSVDYRLAPEHPHPAAVDDVVAVAADLITAGRRVVLAGDSAGGFLALSAAERLFAGYGARVAGVVGLCPLVEVDAGTGPLPAAYVGSAIGLIRVRDDGARPRRDEPPVLVQTADTEALHEPAVTFVDALVEAGGDAEHQVWSGLWHTWQYHRELPEAHQALDEVVAWIGRLA